MSIDLKALKRKSKSEEYIGARVPAELKESLNNVCKAEGISVATLLIALVEDFLKTKKCKDK